MRIQTGLFRGVSCPTFAARGIGLVPPPEHQSQGNAVESERFPELVDKVALVRIMDIIGLVGKNDE